MLQAQVAATFSSREDSQIGLLASWSAVAGTLMEPAGAIISGA